MLYETSNTSKSAAREVSPWRLLLRWGRSAPWRWACQDCDFSDQSAQIDSTLGCRFVQHSSATHQRHRQSRGGYIEILPFIVARAAFKPLWLQPSRESGRLRCCSFLSLDIWEKPAQCKPSASHRWSTLVVVFSSHPSGCSKQGNLEHSRMQCKAIANLRQSCAAYCMKTSMPEVAAEPLPALPCPHRQQRAPSASSGR